LTAVLQKRQKRQTKGYSGNPAVPASIAKLLVKKATL
jgi:hypothetical protein